ncbi:equilibrative nucleoside transporter 3 isoform X2 [Neocloeon triangulifer]|uniref:equilibrative nucleoside transporter 3 isoform X2 n=1 Tax=Neocloeon triangulifer TaxID=2078957 RepID=UPI00286EBFE9|nr:equilibrative nucleoside transporter 3 isoform X2 [Neocloeon triangulifer]
MKQPVDQSPLIAWPQQRGRRAPLAACEDEFTGSPARRPPTNNEQRAVPLENGVAIGNDDQPPLDRYNLVYFIFLLHGVGTLMPWNMFITAKEYFVDYKLSEDYTGVKTELAANFLAYVGLTAQIPNVIFNWANILWQGKGESLTTRVVWSLVIEVIIFILTVVLAMVDTSTWPQTFFIVTMCSVAALNMANGVYQNTVYGMAAKLPFKYTGAVVLGSNISGTFTSLVSIISLLIAPDPRTAAIYYFITALFILLVCFDTYFALPLNRFYRYHEMVNEKEQQARRRANLGQVTNAPLWPIFKQCLPQLFNIFFTFFVTLSIFPAVHADIRRFDMDFFISEKFFTEITCFLTFNLFAMIGSMTASWFPWPGPKYLVVPVVLRVFFIPFFIVCNYQPLGGRLFPVLITSDWAYWIAAMLLGITGGHFSALGMMYCPRMVEPQHAVRAGMLGAGFLITGIFSGILFTILPPIFVKNVSWPV